MNLQNLGLVLLTFRNYVQSAKSDADFEGKLVLASDLAALDSDLAATIKDLAAKYHTKFPHD